MNCNECRDLINLYLDRELEEHLRTDVESHLAGCPGCSYEAADWQACLSWLRRTFPEQAPPVELWEKIRARVGIQ